MRPIEPKKLQSIATGLLTFVPGLYALKMAVKPRAADGGAGRAGFCWEQWIKHLCFLSAKSGMKRHPDSIAELGPGGSIGVGLAGLLTGANRLYALDVREWADISHNISVLRELVGFARNKAARAVDGWPGSRDILGSNSFPSDLVPDAALHDALSDRRIQAIEEQLKGSRSGQGVTIRYIAPWNDPSVMERNSLDLIFTHAVLEHVDDLFPAYQSMFDWLKRGGFMSHHIDLCSHGVSKYWNGQYTYSNLAWKIVRGKRLYLINRQPCSVHLDLIARAGFSLRYSLKATIDSPIGRSSLAAEWKKLSEEDFHCAGLFVQAVKPQ